MKYKLFDIVSDVHHLQNQKEFEDFTNRKDIKILRVHTVATRYCVHGVVYYEDVDVKSEDRK